MKTKLLLTLTTLSLLTLSPLMAEASYDESKEAAGIYAQESGIEPVATPEDIVEPKFAGWYMRTKVYATAADGKVYWHETAGVFGKLKQCIYNKDIHDIPSFGPSILQVVFPKTKWGEDNGDYFSDYYRWTREKSGKRAVWTFQIKNQHTVDLSHADIRIKLKGQQNITFTRKDGVVKYAEAKLKWGKREAYNLVDVDNAKVYEFSQVRNAHLNMDGLHTRTFRWVRGDVKAADLKPLVLPEAEEAETQGIEKTAASSSALKSAGKFGLPPQ
ncbi:MAG: hypothetical protein KAG56_11270 [Sulfurovaceae bacterium]|nr:hypothetical protein [Sulfurovaceae bacterium]